MAERQAADSAGSAPRLRVLCLHGMGTSACILRRQLRPLLDACEGDGIQFVFLGGQERCPAVRRLDALHCESSHAHARRLTKSSPKSSLASRILGTWRACVMPFLPFLA